MINNFYTFGTLKSVHMNYRNFSFAILMAVGVLSCKRHEPTDLTRENLIPKPVSVTATAGVFELTKASAIYTERESAEVKQIRQYLAGKLSPATGFGLKVSSTYSADQS